MLTAPMNLFLYSKQHKKLLLLLVIVLNSLVCFSQSFLGKTNNKVNFRSGPGTEYSIIKSLPKGSQVFIIDSEISNDFYQIIDIGTNQYGFIHKDFLIFGEAVEKQKGGQFTPNGSSNNYNPEIEIYNNTKIELTLRINSNNYSFRPQEKRKISLASGKCDYIASAPGVIPSTGIEMLESNMSYTWQFYILTTKY
jgi:hypothetical protein